MGKRTSARDLGRRERQIMDVIFELGEASVADVLERLYLDRLQDGADHEAVLNAMRAAGLGAEA